MMGELQIIGSKIKILPNRPPFMMDADSAMLYETTTKHINQAVKRNSERFPSDFVFQLTQKEAESCGFAVPDWHSKNDGRGGRRSLPYGFTREGCNMLAAVLNTPVAVARSVQIMRAFSAMERGENVTSAALEKVVDTLAEFGDRLKEIESRPPVHINLPDDTALPISIERKRPHRSHSKVLRDPEVRDLMLSMGRAGYTYEKMTQAVKDRWPDEPERHPSRSAVGRFWKYAREGRYKEFGIDVTTVR